MKNIVSICFLFSLTSGSVLAAPSALSPFAFDAEKAQTLEINNRILFKIQGKAISVLDVVHKMDLLFFRQYPEYASSPLARYQFYVSAWRTVLANVIDDQLILADAKEKKVEISDGEVREELEKLFGPDVVMNLDKMGLSLDEAFDLLKTELVVRRMTQMMVNSKALQQVYPKQVREKYQAFLKEQPVHTRWKYKVLSIRGKEHARVAEKAYALLKEHSQPLNLSILEEVATTLKENESVELSLSDFYERNDSELSLAHKAILQTLAVGQISAPIAQNEVSRLFFVADMQTVIPPVFKEVADKLKQDLNQEAFERNNIAYREKLRKQYGLGQDTLKKMFPEDFNPFALL